MVARKAMTCFPRDQSDDMPHGQIHGYRDAGGAQRWFGKSGIKNSANLSDARACLHCKDTPYLAYGGAPWADIPVMSRFRLAIGSTV
jgi:hypothetical protein